MELENCDRKLPILLIILTILVFSVIRVDDPQQALTLPSESEYRKMQPKGPVCPPLRERPYQKKTFKA